MVFVTENLSMMTIFISIFIPKGAFMKDLCEQNKYPHNLDVTEIFDIWEGHKFRDILTYR